jgi:hypothetical protein
MILAAAFVLTGQPEMSQTQGVWVLAHGHHPSKTKSVQNGRRKIDSRPPSPNPLPKERAFTFPALLKITRRDWPDTLPQTQNRATANSFS